MILAEDGRKMSKSLKNYPDPFQVIEHNGADALRAFLINSPVMRAEPLRFSEAGVREVVRTVMLPLWNAYSFFTTYAEADGIGIDDLRMAAPPAERPEIDRWILSVLQTLIRRVNTEMEGYYLYAVVPAMLAFIDDLTNWYIRRSRRRFWRSRTADDTDKVAAFATLYEVLVTFAKVLAPLLPFITEELYQHLVVDQRPEDAGPRSIHHADYPETMADLIATDLEEAMATVRTVVNLGRALRVSSELKVRQPLPGLTVVSRDAGVRAAVAGHTDLIADELNVKRVDTSDHEDHLVHLSAKADFKVLGPRLGARVKEVAAGIAALGDAEVSALLDGRSLDVAGERISAGDVVVNRTPQEGRVVAAEGPLVVVLDTDLTPELVTEGYARELVNRVQALRRDAGLDVTDRVRLSWASPDPEVARAFTEFGEFVAAEVLASHIAADAGDDAAIVDVNGAEVRLAIAPATT